MEKKLCQIVSNGSLTNHPDNTLTSFDNDIPNSYLAKHKKWKLLVESIGFHCQFMNLLTSKNNLYPAVMLVDEKFMTENIWPYREHTIDRFRNEHQYFLDPLKNYTEESIHTEFISTANDYLKARGSSYFCGYPSKYDETTKMLYC